MENQQTEIRIYVACLASYNNGTMHGEWIDASQGIDGIWKDVSQMLLRSNAEYAKEWAIHDYEGFECIRLSEHESFEQVAQYAAFIEKYGALGAKLLKYFNDLDDAKSALEDNYYGQFESVADYAEQFIADTVEVPQSLVFYIDYEKMERDLEINDVLTIETAHDEVHVFGWW